MCTNCLNNVNKGGWKPIKSLQKKPGDYQSEDRPLNLVFWLLAADHVSESNSTGRVKQKWMQPQVQLHVCAATIWWCSAFRCCCAPTQTSDWPLNLTSFTWRRFRADLSSVCLEVLTYFTVWPNIWWSVLQPKRAKARHRNPRLRRSCTIFCNSDANPGHPSKYKTRFLLCSPQMQRGGSQWAWLSSWQAAVPPDVRHAGSQVSAFMSGVLSLVATAHRDVPPAPSIFLI